MKTFKTKKNKYGRFLVIHLLNDGSINIFKKNTSYRKYETDISIWRKDDIQIFEKVLKERRKQIKENK